MLTAEGEKNEEKETEVQDERTVRKLVQAFRRRKMATGNKERICYVIAESASLCFEELRSLGEMPEWTGKCHTGS